jgi:putative modified peptide
VKRIFVRLVTLYRGSGVAESKLTRVQAETLLEKLSNDDTFRALFEMAPAKALNLVGLTPETIINLPANCLVPVKLATKDTYIALLKQQREVTINAAMGMIAPNLGPAIGPAAT